MSTEVNSRCVSCGVESDDDCVYTPLGTQILEDLIVLGGAVLSIRLAPSQLLKVDADYSGLLDFDFYADHYNHQIEVITEYGEVLAVYKNSVKVEGQKLLSEQELAEAKKIFDRRQERLQLASSLLPWIILFFSLLIVAYLAVAGK